jgi:hypothetical protein
MLLFYAALPSVLAVLLIYFKAIPSARFILLNQKNFLNGVEIINKMGSINNGPEFIELTQEE